MSTICDGPCACTPSLCLLVRDYTSCCEPLRHKTRLLIQHRVAIVVLDSKIKEREGRRPNVDDVDARCLGGRRCHGVVCMEYVRKSPIFRRAPALPSFSVQGEWLGQCPADRDTLCSPWICAAQRMTPLRRAWYSWSCHGTPLCHDRGQCPKFIMSAPHFETFTV